MSAAPFGVIVADCPWKYGGSDQFQSGRAGRQYPTMATRDLCALPVATIAADDCLLLLWVTNPLLEDALRVMKAWGFAYKTKFPWIKLEGDPQRTLTGEWVCKPQYGLGFWGRGPSEDVWICQRGKIEVPTLARDSLLLLSQNFGHSKKPENLYEYAELFSGPHAELFARQHRAGWAQFGNGIDGRDIREAIKEGR